jgi:hypothetical protein
MHSRKSKNKKHSCLRSVFLKTLFPPAIFKTPTIKHITRDDKKECQNKREIKRPIIETMKTDSQNKSDNSPYFSLSKTQENPER